MPSRRRSTQAITERNPSSLCPTRDASDAIVNNATRDIAPEKIVTMALDGVNDDSKVRAQYKNDGPQEFASAFLNSGQKTQVASLVDISVFASSEPQEYPNSHLPAFESLDTTGSSTLYSEERIQGRHTSDPGITNLKIPVAQSHAQRFASSSCLSGVDSFESSRRGSLIKIQRLSERLVNLKSYSNSDHGLKGLSSTTVVSRMPVPQFTWAGIKETSASSEAEGLHFRRPRNPTWDAGVYEACDLPPSRATEKLKADISHEDSIVRKDRDFCRNQAFSSEVHDINCDSSKYADGKDGYTSCRRHGHDYDFSGSVGTNLVFVRERAPQNHAGSGSPPPQTMPVNIGTSTTLKSFDSRTQGGVKPKARPGLQRGVEYTSSDSLHGHLQPNTSSDLNLPKAMDTYLHRDKAVLMHTGTTSARSWCRYPSHNRVERSFSPAGAADNVTSRDFAIEFRGFGIADEQKEIKSSRKKKSRSLTFGKSIMNTLSQIYSIDLRRQHKGHRSSISVGGKLEYPELEILPHLSPTLRPLDVVAQQDITSGLRAMHPITSRQSVIKTSFPSEESINASRSWSKLYEDCVHHPVDGDERRTGGNTSRILLRSRAVSTSARNHPNNGEPSPHSSGDMRSSTSDFHISLQNYETKAKERALQAADNASGKPRELP